MKHIHKFKNIGGGMSFVEKSEFNCDDEYKCECGIGFKLLTTITGHRYLPQEFYFEEPNEIKKAELDAIGDVLINGGNFNLK